jgi:hypothetical protein
LSPITIAPITFNGDDSYRIILNSLTNLPNIDPLFEPLYYKETSMSSLLFSALLIDRNYKIIELGRA